MRRLPIKDFIALLLLASLLFLPVASLKANRTQRGQPLTLSDVSGFSKGIWVLGFYLLAGLALSLERGAAKIAAAAIRLSFSLLPAILIFLIGGSLPSGIPASPARLGLGAGFFLAVIGSLMLSGSKRPSMIAYILFAASITAAVLSGNAQSLSLYREFVNRRDTFVSEVGNHLKLSFLSAAAAVVPGVLMGYACYISPKAKRWITGFINLVQVLPTLSLLGLVMIPLSYLARSIPLLSRIGIKGIGFAPAFIALGLYCLLPITLNTMAGFASIDQRALFSAKAMGMTGRQILTQIEIPLAFPVIFSGVRTAITQNVGNATIAGLVGGGGMGTIIFLGLSQAASDLVLLGTLPVILMALILDAALVAAEWRIRKAVTH